VKIAQAQAAAGKVQTVRIAQLIPSDQASRVTALGSIAAAQTRLGMASEAKETFTQARQFADVLADQLSRAEVLHSLARGEADAGMAAEATNTFEESLKLAETVAATPEVLSKLPCMPSASAESRLDGPLKGLAEQQARAGSLSNALCAVGSIVYEPSARAETLQAIAEIQAQSGQKDAAGQVLKEVLVWFQVPPPARWPSCPDVRHLPPSGDLDARRRAGATDLWISRPAARQIDRRIGARSGEHASRVLLCPRLEKGRSGKISSLRAYRPRLVYSALLLQ
jgi:hypothetical protein